MNDELDYLNNRARQERRAALRSENGEVAQVHRDLADAYEFRAFLLKRATAFHGAEPLLSCAAPTER